MQNFQTFDSMDRLLKCDQFVGNLFSSTSLWCRLFVCFFQFYPVRNFVKFLNFELGTVKSQRAKVVLVSLLLNFIVCLEKHMCRTACKFKKNF